MKNQLTHLLLVVLFLYGCQTYQAKPYDFPKPVDTTSKEIQYQEKKTYQPAGQGVYASNLFDGARLNDFKFIEGNTFQATIEPENTPINQSPYYAFKLWSKDKKHIDLELNYKGSKHRYEPKFSKDGQNWNILNNQQWNLAPDSINAILHLEIGPDTLWIAAQEIQNSSHIRQWCAAKAKQSGVQLSSIGKSKLGKDLWRLDIGIGEHSKKDVIVILSRQHPPEVTGWFAMRAFVDNILEDNPLANAFRKKYRILVYPLMNPDGVDLGHWRHNAGGVDLNRDWAYYNQPENRQIADDIVRISKQNKSKVILGLDFHSTYYDVYYTNKDEPKYIPNFEKYWLQGIHESLGEDINERPSNVGGPVSKNWFLTQFGAVGITYEIGDSTPRDYILEKGKVSAIEMMELLIFQ